MIACPQTRLIQIYYKAIKQRHTGYINRLLSIGAMIT